MSELQALPKLTFATRLIPSKDVGKSGELRWLPLSQLSIDADYQRAILDSGKANIRRIIEEFSWAKFGTVTVSRRGASRYAIIDGQHRAAAALNHGGIDQIPCLILERTLAEEARAFAAINHNVTRIHPLQSFRAAVAGGDESAVALVRLCAEAGVTIAPYPKPSEFLRPGETMALNAVRSSVRKHGEKSTLTALVMLRAADPSAFIPGVTVQALCETVPKHPEWNQDAAARGEALTRSGGGLAKLVADAMERKLSRGGAAWVNIAALAEQRIASAARAGGAPMSRLMAGR